jgi:hypothetical protein
VASRIEEIEASVLGFFNRDRIVHNFDKPTGLSDPLRGSKRSVWV